MGWYKLTGYDYKQWDYTNGEYPQAQIETIVSNVEGASWDEITNVSLAPDMSTATIKSTADNLPYYIKYKDSDNSNWYYKLMNLSQTKNTNKEGVLEYYGLYSLDNYQTIFCRKLSILDNQTGLKVYAKTGFQPRFRIRDKVYVSGEPDQTIVEFNSTLYQPWLSNFMALNEPKIIRSICETTSPGELLIINYDRPGGQGPVGNITYPTRTPEGEASIGMQWKGESFWNPTNPTTKEYTYLILKSSACAKVGEDKTYAPFKTEQSIFIVPILNYSETETVVERNQVCWKPESIWHALNDQSLTKVNQYGGLNLAAANVIGVWTTNKVTFNMLYFASEAGKLTKWSSPCRMADSEISLNVMYYEMQMNTVIDWKIFETAIPVNAKGNLIQRIQHAMLYRSSLTMSTEPLMFAAPYLTQAINDGSCFYKFDLSQVKVNAEIDRVEAPGSMIFGSHVFQGYFLPSDQLYCGINWGSDTNTYNQAFDDKAIVQDVISKPLQILSSSATNYIANNASTMNAGLTNLKTQQELDKLNLIWGTEKSGMGVANSGSIGSAILGGLKTFGDTVTGIFSMKKQHEMQDRNFRAAINNIKSVPSQTLGSASLKAAVPSMDVNKAWTLYNDEMSDGDKELYFKWYLSNGYVLNRKVRWMNNNSPVDGWYYLNEGIRDGRKYMNVICLDTERSRDEIYKVLNQRDSGKFANEYYNELFISWLGETNRIYVPNASYSKVNCTDPDAGNYVSNVEYALHI